MEEASLNSLTLYTSNILIPNIDNLHQNLNIISNHLFGSNIQMNV